MVVFGNWAWVVWGVVWSLVLVGDGRPLLLLCGLRTPFHMYGSFFSRLLSGSVSVWVSGGFPSGVSAWGKSGFLSAYGVVS